jgi:hypothetical protein
MLGWLGCYLCFPSRKENGKGASRLRAVSGMAAALNPHNFALSGETPALASTGTGLAPSRETTNEGNSHGNN